VRSRAVIQTCAHVTVFLIVLSCPTVEYIENSLTCETCRFVWIQYWNL